MSDVAKGVIYMAFAVVRGKRAVHDRDRDKYALYLPWLSRARLRPPVSVPAEIGDRDVA